MKNNCLEKYQNFERIQILPIFNYCSQYCKRKKYNQNIKKLFLKKITYFHNKFLQKKLFYINKNKIRLFD